MNITQALNVALPDLPAKLVRQHYPCLHPEVVFKEHIEEGKPVVRAYVPGVDSLYAFPSDTWKLIELFDGRRSYSEVAELYSQQTGIEYSEDALRDLAAEIDAMDFWYKTPLEKNLRLMEKSASERRRLHNRKSKWGDLSSIAFPAVDPDRFLTWLHGKLGFVFERWFVVVSLVGLAFSVGIFITHWSEIGRDTLEFYNFSHKSRIDLAAFWILGALLMCAHETGHGFACKHYGGRVPAMGFLLIYLTPAFYTDTTQGDVLGTRFQRLVITVAGVWTELMICAIATPIWWLTPPGTAIHDFAYLIMLLTGIAVVLINWNPLIKLDGYHILTQLVGISDLKEASTLYLSGWVKKNIWRLPVEVPYVPRRRRPGYVVYAILSGLYSYSLLYVFASFIGNIARGISTDWGFVFEYGTAYLIFRGRLRTLWNFMKLVYLDKRDRVRAWLTPMRKLATAAAAAIFVLLPLWHESASGRFVLEPASHAVVRAVVPGTVTQVYAHEGQRIEAGAPLVQMRNLELDSQLARSQSELAIAASRAMSAQLRYADAGSAGPQREGLIRQTREISSEVAQLQVRAPIAGVVTTPRLSDRLGTYATEGSELLELADLNRLRARIYISEYEMYKLEPDSAVRLHIDGEFKRHWARTVAVEPAPPDIPPGLMDLSKFKGQRPPKFYVFDVALDNPEGTIKSGMAGTAKVYGRRRSLVGLAFQRLEDIIGGKIW